MSTLVDPPDAIPIVPSVDTSDPPQPDMADQQSILDDVHEVVSSLEPNPLTSLASQSDPVQPAPAEDVLSTSDPENQKIPVQSDEPEPVVDESQEASTATDSGTLESAEETAVPAAQTLLVPSPPAEESLAPQQGPLQAAVVDLEPEAIGPDPDVAPVSTNLQSYASESPSKTEQGTVIAATPFPTSDEMPNTLTDTDSVISPTPEVDAPPVLAIDPELPGTLSMTPENEAPVAISVEPPPSVAQSMSFKDTVTPAMELHPVQTPDFVSVPSTPVHEVDAIIPTLPAQIAMVPTPAVDDRPPILRRDTSLDVLQSAQAQKPSDTVSAALMNPPAEEIESLAPVPNSAVSDIKYEGILEEPFSKPVDNPIAAIEKTRMQADEVPIQATLEPPISIAADVPVPTPILAQPVESLKPVATVLEPIEKVQLKPVASRVIAIPAPDALNTRFEQATIAPIQQKSPSFVAETSKSENILPTRRQPTKSQVKSPMPRERLRLEEEHSTSPTPEARCHRCGRSYRDMTSNYLSFQQAKGVRQAWKERRYMKALQERINEDTRRRLNKSERGREPSTRSLRTKGSVEDSSHERSSRTGSVRSFWENYLCGDRRS